MSAQQCFLDLDGVLVDFVDGACKVHARDNPYLNGVQGQYDLDKVFGMFPSEFWAPMDHTFWSNLSMLPDAPVIIELVKRYFDERQIAILSCPAKQPGSLTGKVTWLENNLPEFARRYVLAPNKYFCAGPGKILIDDFEKNVDEFNAAGGRAFLLPRPWNSAHADQKSAVAMLSDFLDKVCQPKERSISALTQEKVAV